MRLSLHIQLEIEVIEGYPKPTTIFTHYFYKSPSLPPPFDLFETILRVFRRKWSCL